MEPYIGEIKLFAGDFAPRGWFFCDGTLLDINYYQKLFSLIQTYYGGNGQTNFALPDLRGRAPVQPGQGPNLKVNYGLGQQGGKEEVILSQQQMPAHSHSLKAVSAGANQFAPENNYLSITLDKTTEQPTNSYNDATVAGVTFGNLHTASVVPAGGSTPVNIVSPVLAINYIIAWEGIYPSRP
ncbi:phage tail protein [Pedobacter psychroterrae]|uniref:Phage tail protein n=1 Tax=Pedobacter psychroterrae TaxID=2530453 RepID=A0A4R0NRD1_9SPHI|nr:tail fiber protein [Pedobacter psychroterrae]TCD02739.1 phage tail protein [Pedobacter psychroterrae]